MAKGNHGRWRCGGRGGGRNEDPLDDGCRHQRVLRDTENDDLRLEVRALRRSIAYLEASRHGYSDLFNHNKDGDEFDYPFAHAEGERRFQHHGPQPLRSFGAQLKIPKFTGKVLPNQFLNWLTKIERLFILRNLSDKHKVHLAAVSFKSYASIWWTRVQLQRVREGKSLVESWATMKKLLYKKFYPEVFQRDSDGSRLTRQPVRFIKRPGFGHIQAYNPNHKFINVVDTEFSPVYNEYPEENLGYEVDSDKGAVNHNANVEEVKIVDIVGSYFDDGDVANAARVDEVVIVDVIGSASKDSRGDIQDFKEVIVKPMENDVRYPSSSKGEIWSKLKKIANDFYNAASLKIMSPSMITSVETILEIWEDCERKEIQVLKKEYRILKLDISNITFGSSSYLEGNNIFDMLMKLTLIVSKSVHKIKYPGINRLLPINYDLESFMLDKGIRDCIVRLITKWDFVPLTTDERSEYLDSLAVVDYQVPYAFTRYFVDAMNDECGKDIDVSSWEHEPVSEPSEQESGESRKPRVVDLVVTFGRRGAGDNAAIILLKKFVQAMFVFYDVNRKVFKRRKKSGYLMLLVLSYALNCTTDVDSWSSLLQQGEYDADENESRAKTSF